VSALPAPPSLAGAYMDCLTIDRDGDIIAVNEEQWRALEEVRAALDAPFPAEVATLTRPDGVTSAWLFCGLWLLMGDGPNRQLACDFAEHVLPICEAAHPGDMRPRRAIEVARAYVRGEAAAEEMEAARKGANATAAHAADATAADAAAYAVAAATATAATAVYAAAVCAAADAERQWQTARVALYVSGVLP
jgi:hypothetical protein